MKLLNALFLDQQPPDLGIPGVQPCPLVGFFSGYVRDAKGNRIAARNALEPLDLGVIYDALRPFKDGDWVLLDAEEATTYVFNEMQARALNDKGLANWEAFVKGVRMLRPKLQIGININVGGTSWGQWGELWKPAARSWINWTERAYLRNAVVTRLLSVADAMVEECYIGDVGGDENASLYGPGTDRPFAGFVPRLHHQMLSAHDLGKKVIVLTSPSYSTGPRDGQPVLPDTLRAMLDLIDPYAPAAVAMWGAMQGQNPVTYSDSLTVGRWDAKAAWVDALRGRAK